ncbi:MAG: histidine kinase, partial [Lapillicoccus sp.]
MTALLSLPAVMRLRLLVAGGVVVAIAVGTDGYRMLPWALLVVAMELGSAILLRDARLFALRRRTFYAAAPTLIGALCAGLALAFGPSALPLAAIPLSRAAESWGRRVALLTTSAWLASAVASLLLAPRPAPVDLAPFGRWGAVAGAVLLAAWLTHRSAGAPLRPTNPVAEEAALLLARLAHLSSDLQGGMDAATSAEMLLDTLGRPGPLARSAVLLGSTEDHPVPLALRGADRIPWPDPTLDRGVLGQAWRWGRPGASWDLESHREIRAIPLLASGGKQVGILVQDVVLPAPSDDADLDEIRRVAQHFGPLLGVALSFARLRERAGYEERERLAREMHDGIAQELVALGFQLDLVTRAASRSGELPQQTLAQLEAARTQLRHILGDLRSHISDLRVSVRPERGLGAAITSRIQSFGTSTEVVVSLRLDESGFRLPARAETALYRVFLEVLADVKKTGATSFDVDLTVVAPDALLRMRHDGHTALTAESFTDHPLTHVGGRIRIAPSEGLDLVAEVSSAASAATPAHVSPHASRNASRNA